ncbi:MAG: cell division protein PerM [Mycetocola sp.]
MNRLTLALLTALEAVVIVAIGLVIPLLLGGLLWGAEFDFSGDAISVWRGAVDVWLLGHGVPITIGLDAATMTRIGAPADLGVLELSLPPLGFALGTALAALRTGRRCVETQWMTVLPVGTFVVGGVSLLIAATANVTGAGPNMVAATFFPALVYLCGASVGVLIRSRRGEVDPGVFAEFARRVNDWLPAQTPSVLRAAGRSAGVFLIALTGLAAAGFVISLLGSFSTMVSLYESTDYGVIGGILITLVHLAYLPTLLVWSGAWLLGPGFAIGADTIVSPIATQLGPLPAVPVLGAVPQWDSSFGLLIVVLPIAAAALGAMYARVRAQSDATLGGIRVRLAVVGVSALFAALVTLVLTSLASGAMGPGALNFAGPHPWVTAGCAAFISAAGGAIAWIGPNRPARRDTNGRS